MNLQRTVPLIISALGLFFLADTQFAAITARAAAPVLVLTDQGAANPFGQYAAEILRGEGLLAFEQRDRASWSANPNAGAILSSYSAVVMSEMSLSAPEQQLLRSYVQAGGVLIGAKPDVALSDVFGIQFAGNRSEQTLPILRRRCSQSPGSRHHPWRPCSTTELRRITICKERRALPISMRIRPPNRDAGRHDARLWPRESHRIRVRSG